jgi:hypothetical protein
MMTFVDIKSVMLPTAVGAPRVVRDIIQWNWQLIAEPSVENEVLEIEWEGSDAVSTPVAFRFVATAPVAGLLKDLYLGRLKEGEIVSHSIPLSVARCVELGDIMTVLCSSEKLSAAVEPGSKDLQYLRVKFQAPNRLGRFEETLDIKFGDPGVPQYTMRVFGTVFDLAENAVNVDRKSNVLSIPD